MDDVYIEVLHLEALLEDANREIEDLKSKNNHLNKMLDFWIQQMS